MRFSIACNSINIKQGSDRWIWKQNATFSIRQATLGLQPSLPTIDWHRVFWCIQFLPRYAIILQLAWWKRMPTLDKCMDQGVSNSNSCLSCCRFIEDQDHLFFHCACLSRVWNAVLQKMKCQRSSESWQDALDWLKAKNSWGSKLQKDMATFAFSPSVSHLQRERNFRLYQNVAKYHDEVINDILQNICYSLESWRRYKYSKFNQELVINLGASLKILTRTGLARESANANHRFLGI